MKALTNLEALRIRGNSQSRRQVDLFNRVFRLVLSKTADDFERRELECLGAPAAIPTPSDCFSVVRSGSAAP